MQLITQTTELINKKVQCSFTAVRNSLSWIPNPNPHAALAASGDKIRHMAADTWTGNTQGGAILSCHLELLEVTSTSH